MLLITLDFINRWEMLILLLLCLTGLRGWTPCPCLLYDVNPRNLLGIFVKRSQTSVIVVILDISFMQFWTRSLFYHFFQVTKLMKLGLQDWHVDNLPTRVEADIKSQYECSLGLMYSCRYFLPLWDIIVWTSLKSKSSGLGQPAVVRARPHEHSQPFTANITACIKLSNSNLRIHNSDKCCGSFEFELNEVYFMLEYHPDVNFKTSGLSKSCCIAEWKKFKW